MAYRKGVPQVKSYNPPREAKPYDVDPSTMGGTVDPLTALYATLRDVDKGTECQVSLKMFDGRRHSQITTSERQEAGEQVVCQGEYRRLAGFSAEDALSVQPDLFAHRRRADAGDRGHDGQPVRQGAADAAVGGLCTHPFQSMTPCPP
jgi:hypothetical protein